MNLNDPAVRRGRKRLAALGIDPDTNDLEAVRTWYEHERARYVHLAENGLHMAPTHAIFGMAAQAIADANGWDDLPEDWSPGRVEWPTPIARTNGATGC